MKKTDCIIIGSGIAGVSLAWRLYQANISFYMISNPDLSSSSLIAPGIINPITFKRIVPSWNITQLLESSIGFYKEIELILNQKFFEPIHLWHYLHNNEEIKLWKQKQLLYPRFLGDVKKMTSSDNLYFKQNFLYAEVLNGWRLQVKDYIQHSLLFFKSKDLFCQESFNHNDLVIHQDNIIYHNISAKKIIFCEGYLMKNNPYFRHIPLKPAKGEIIEIETENPILPEKTVLHKTLNIIAVEKNKYLIGSNYEWKHLNETPTDGLKQKFLSIVEELFDTNYKIIHHYAGIRPASVDRKPIIEQHSSFSNLYLLNGYGTKGVLLSPYSANVLIKKLY